jgi:hypothetical protein
MPFDQSELDPIEIRAQKAMCKSYGLIRECDALSATIISSQNKIVGKSVFGGDVAAQTSYDSLTRRQYSILSWAVDSALRVTNATKANLQILDPASGLLYIAEQRGFRQPFLDFFKTVHAGEAACGKALETCGRVIIEDVTESPIFCGTPALEVLLDAEVRAVQSTPLLGPSGAINGILSTHWPSPRRLSNGALSQLNVVAGIVAHWLEHNLYASSGSVGLPSNVRR